MKSPTDIPAYNFLYKRKCLEALITHTSQILINQLGIYEGNNLVGIIGDASEKTNYDAIKSWVSNSIGSFEGRIPLEIAADLENELRMTLLNSMSIHY